MVLQSIVSVASLMVSFIHRVEILATEWHSLEAFTGLEAWEREQDKLDICLIWFIYHVNYVMST